MDVIGVFDSSVGALVGQVAPKTSVHTNQPKDAEGAYENTRQVALQLIQSALSTSTTGHDLDVLA